MKEDPEQPFPGSRPRGQINGAVSISKRPAEAEDRAVPGHWEGDLITVSKNGHIATLVERHSRFVKLVKVDGNDTTSMVNALVREVQCLPEGLMSSLSWDRSMEPANYRVFSVETGVDVFFCDPSSPRQRGTKRTPMGCCVSTAKHTDPSVYSQVHLDAVALRLKLCQGKLSTTAAAGAGTVHVLVAADLHGLSACHCGSQRQRRTAGSTTANRSQRLSAQLRPDCEIQP